MPVKRPAQGPQLVGCPRSARADAHHKNALWVSHRIEEVLNEQVIPELDILVPAKIASLLVLKYVLANS